MFPSASARLIHAAVVAAVCVAPMAGCLNMMPDVSSPGPAPLQQSRAAFHDPYPDPNLAPPVVGGRPREYQVPHHEAVKNRSFVDRYVP